MVNIASEVRGTLLTCIDGWYGTKRLQIGRPSDRFLASAIDDTRRDALKSASRVAAQLVTKSADKLSQITCAYSSDSGDLPSPPDDLHSDDLHSIDPGLAVSLTPQCTEQQDFYRGGSERRSHRHVYDL
jgi:hypothetical protein